ncbi:MAG: YjzC family protein [candidate division Zixibacteria bacterium]|nr:YjzC family protein [candidate division Zixibacteria bacterium]
MSKRIELKPGETAPASGQYEIIGPRGGETGIERTIVKGETMPPTPNKGQSYIIVDRSKNDAGKGR